METEVVDVPRPFGATYAQPLAGLRVSWGAILAGAVATTAVAVLLWALAFAIILTATHASLSSVRGSTLALWICAIATTIVGAFVGGALAGYLPGNVSRRIALGHGFLSWCLAFIVTTMVGWGVLAGVGQLLTTTAVTTASGVIQGTGAAVGGAVGATTPQPGQTGATGPMGFTPVEEREIGVLVTLGYSPAQARQMMMDQRAAAQRATQGQGNTENAGDAAKGAVKSAGSSVLSFLEAAGWSWWGTWTVALFAALAGAAAGARRLRRLADVEAAPTEGPVGGEAGTPTAPPTVVRPPAIVT